jgi:5-methylcytosine-specific restriction endonuclease McrA
MTTNPSYVRQQVFKRDKGVCRSCGFNADIMVKGLESLRCASSGSKEKWDAYRACSNTLGLIPRKSLWDADHIKPVVEDGGGCGLENYQTLCVWCHKEKTARQKANKKA